MAVDMAGLLADLAAESADLDAVLAGLREENWSRATPAPGWDIRDQVTHLAFFDEVATLAATDRDRFDAQARALARSGREIPDEVAELTRDRTGPAAWNWLRRARAEFLAALAGLDPAETLPWFGPPMTAASSATARLMETWAHGQDIVDALGLTRRPTSRLRHVAHLGVATFGWSFRVHGRPVPDAPVRIELRAPDGDTWSWGPADAADRVAGSAEDFCLVVVQRRHRSATGLSATGPAADAWLDVAQAFAGGPGAGRPAGPDPALTPGRRTPG